MPRKKVRVEKDRSYLEKLLDEAGVDDKAIALAIKAGLSSSDSTERKNAVAMAARMRGFEDVDKTAGQDLEALPIANCDLADMDLLANRCAYCKHGKYEPIKKSTEAIPEGPAPAAPAAEEPGDELQDVDNPAIAEAIKGLNEQDPEETPR